MNVPLPFEDGMAMAWMMGLLGGTRKTNVEEDGRWERILVSSQKDPWLPGGTPALMHTSIITCVVTVLFSLGRGYSPECNCGDV